MRERSDMRIGVTSFQAPTATGTRFTAWSGWVRRRSSCGTLMRISRVSTP